MEVPTTVTTTTDTTIVARPIPPPLQPWWLHSMFCMVLTGIIPFLVEIFFIMTSLRMDQYYYMFEFAPIVYLILIITCAEMTVILVYYQLCAENYRWWWYSFFCSGSITFYTYLYSLFWFRNFRGISLIMTYLLYFGYMFMISFGMLLVFGSIGSLTSLWFVRKIYSTIKED
jgi:transmembrane 9 superfamily member 2/4